MRWLLAFSFLLLSTDALAVTPDEVIAWVQEGLGDSEIVERIRRDPPTAPLTAHEALKLKSAGVSDNVLKALIEASSDLPPAPDPVGEPPSKPPAGLVIRTVDDLIEAHRRGVPTRELAARARGLKLKLTRVDRERLEDAGVDAEVIAAAASRPGGWTTRRTYGREPSRFGSSGTVLLEFAGGFQSFSVGDTTISAVHLAPSLHVWLGFLALGLDASFTSGNAGSASFFAVLGPAIAFGSDRSGVFRLGARLGYGAPDAGDGAVAYGFSASFMSRVDRLLIGAGLTGTWMGEPVTSVIGIDLRIGTWF